MIDYTEGSGKQYHTAVGPGDVGRYVILPGDPGRCAKIAAYFDNAEKIAVNREYVTYTGTLDGVKVSVMSTGIGGPSASIAVEELYKSTSREFAPIEYPAVADFDVTCALVQAAREGGHRHHVGVVQCKDSFFGQHEPEVMPVSYELQNKWQAWLRMGCKASEMESAAIFIVGSFLGARTGSVCLVVANQERAKKGLPNKQVHDTDLAIRTAVEAIRILIRKDAEENKPQ